jgi:hypothetical protein
LSKLEAGTTTIDDKLTFEVELECYQQLHEVTKAVAEAINEHLEPESTEPHVFFLDEALRKGLGLRDTVDLQLTNLAKAYKTSRQTAEAARAPAARASLDSADVEKATTETVGPATVAAGFNAAASILNSLMSDTRYSGRQVVVPEQALALALAHCWEGTKVVFHYPTLFSHTSSRDHSAMQRFIQRFNTVTEARSKAAAALARLLAEVSGVASTSPAFSLAKARLDTARDQFQSAEAVFDELNARLSEPDEKTGLSHFELIQRAAFMQSVSGGGSEERPVRTFLVFAQVISAGGAFRVESNFFTRLWGSDGLRHAGGCVVAFAFFDLAGRLLASNVMGQRSPYRDSRPRLSVAIAVADQSPTRRDVPQSRRLATRDDAAAETDLLPSPSNDRKP